MDYLGLSAEVKFKFLGQRQVFDKCCKRLEAQVERKVVAVGYDVEGGITAPIAIAGPIGATLKELGVNVKVKVKVAGSGSINYADDKCLQKTVVQGDGSLGGALEGTAEISPEFLNKILTLSLTAGGSILGSIYKSNVSESLFDIGSTVSFYAKGEAEAFDLKITVININKTFTDNTTASADFLAN
jgi:hypothetical protein